jgi:hypothetical protein
VIGAFRHIALPDENYVGARSMPAGRANGRRSCGVKPPSLEAHPLQKKTQESERAHEAPFVTRSFLVLARFDM